MNSRLVIRRPPSTAAEPVAWLRLDGAGAVVDGGDATLSEIAGYLRGVQPAPPVVVLAPAVALTLMQVDVPDGLRRHLRKALPFVVEEFIADELEDVHLATGPIVRGQPIPVAVVRHSELIGWLDLFYSAGIAPDAMIPEQLAVPWRGGGALLLDGDHGILRTGRFSGTTFDVVDAGIWLHRALAELPEPRRLTLMTGTDSNAESATALADELIAAGDTGIDDPRSDRAAIDVERIAYREPAAEIMAAQAAPAPGDSINLLQGGYHVTSREPRRHFAWRKVAAVAVVCVLINAAFALAAGGWYHWRTTQLQARSADLYRRIVPNAHRVFNPRKQLQSYLRTAGSTSGGFAQALQPVVQAWRKDGPLVLDRLRYDENSATLTLDVSGPAVDSVTALQSAIMQAGGNARVTSMVDRGDGVRAELKLGS